MKLWKALISGCVICMLLSGCWSSFPIEELNMEVGVALDRADETEVEKEFDEKGGNYPKREEISSTYQFIIPQGSGGTKKDTSSSKNYYNMTETGDSIFETVRELALRTRRPPIGHHLKTIVIGDKLARSTNLSELIEFYSRDNDIRPSVLLYISKGRARDVFENALPGQTPVFVLEGIFNNRDRTTRIWKPMSMAKVIGPLYGKRSFLLQNVIADGKETKLAGAGVIKGETGKLVGFMDESELEGMVWLSGKGRGGVLKTYEPNTNKLISYEIKSMKSKIKANVKDEQISFNVKIEATGRYAEAFSANSEKLREGVVIEDEKLLQKHVIDMLQTTVKKMQEELHVEVAEFGTNLHIQHPEVWRKVKKDWDEKFSQIPVTYEVKLNIEGYGASDTTTE